MTTKEALVRAERVVLESDLLDIRPGSRDIYRMAYLDAISDVAKSLGIDLDK